MEERNSIEFLAPYFHDTCSFSLSIASYSSAIESGLVGTTVHGCSYRLANPNGLAVSRPIEEEGGEGEDLPSPKIKIKATQPRTRPERSEASLPRLVQKIISPRPSQLIACSHCCSLQKHDTQNKSGEQADVESVFCGESNVGQICPKSSISARRENRFLPLPTG